MSSAETVSMKSSFVQNFDFTKAAHPKVCFFSILFKALSLFCYFMWKFTDSQFPLIMSIISAACDFWFNKNISGRILVGLRWKSEIQEDGEEKWIFECRSDESKNNSVDTNIFWGSQILFTAIWIAFAIANIFGPDFFKIAINGFMIAMIGTNLFAYYKCSKAQQQRLTSFVTQKATEAAMSQVMKGQVF
eukprot:TRINITY_DN1674_c0_g2_i1.p1 TRINITY_DN1674_c0_g2~~TRINITY_DN1674_c0_g2_i1.p1  ORF type:complete len:190 (-),score=59.93 TRINITY_DN1674_c0_g2_i1:148-717(-)